LQEVQNILVFSISPELFHIAQMESIKAKGNITAAREGKKVITSSKLIEDAAR